MAELRVLRWRDAVYIPGMKVKPPGSCMTPAEAPVVFRTVPLALTLLLAEMGAR